MVFNLAFHKQVIHAHNSGLFLTIMLKGFCNFALKRVQFQWFAASV